MKKRIFRRVTQTGAKLLFSLLALLLVLTGCNVPTPTPPDEPETTGTEQPTEQPIDSVLTPPGGIPSAEFQAELAEAFSQKHGVTWTYRYAEGDATYYGSYRDYAVLFIANSIGAYGNRYFYCGEYKFNYHMNFVVEIYRSGALYPLTEAYQAGWITDGELKTIWETQNATNGRYVETDKCPDIDNLPIEAIFVRVGKLSEEMILQIKTDYLSKKVHKNYKIADLTLWYYGEFQGSAAIIMDGPWGYADALYEEKIGGVIFSYPSSRSLTIYHSGSFYSLSEAYQKGLLTTADLLILRENYIVIQSTYN